MIAQHLMRVVAGSNSVIPLTYYEEVLADSPAAYWRMNEPSGTVAEDSTANNRDGAYTGSPTLGVTGPYAGTTGMTSAATGPKYFEYIPGAALGPEAGDAFTIEIWTNAPLTVDHYLYSCRSSGAGLPGHMLRVTTAGAVGWVGFGTGASSLATPDGVVTANVWTHIALTCDTSGNATFYVNGVSVHTGTIATITNPGATTRRYSGLVRTSGSTIVGSDGTNSDLAIWEDVELSGARIAAHYAAA